MEFKIYEVNLGRGKQNLVKKTEFQISDSKKKLKKKGENTREIGFCSK